MSEQAKEKTTIDAASETVIVWNKRDQQTGRWRVLRGGEMIRLPSDHEPDLFGQVHSYWDGIDA